MGAGLAEKTSIRKKVLSTHVRTSVLCIALLQITKPLRKLLDGDVLVVREEVLLCCLTSVVDQRVGVSSNSCDASDNVSIYSVKRIRRRQPYDRAFAICISMDFSNHSNPKSTHEFNKNTFSPLPPYPAAFEFDKSRSFPVTFFSAAMTTPSFARTPKTVPACEIASIAYSTVRYD